MKVNFFTGKREYAEKKEEFDTAIQSLLTNGVSTLGSQVSEFEDKIKEFTGAKHAIGVASGTDALVLASDILGFSEGREVITSPFTFLASASCIARHKGVPVFVDIDKDTLEIDTTKIEEKITDKTVGILPIHLFCQMADMDSIKSLSEKYNLKVLEDAAEAFGMHWLGSSNTPKHSGTIGDFGIFSFFPTKTLGAFGDGGMIVTNDDNLAALAKSYRVHGASKKYHYDHLGYNSRLDTIQAAILLVKMKYIKEAIKKRNTVATWYYDRLQGIENISFPKIKGNQEGVYYVFNILAEKRDELCEYLKANEVQYSIYYPVPLHLQKCFSYLGYKKGDFPIAEQMSQKVLALPIYPEITEAEVDFVCKTIKNFYKK